MTDTTSEYNTINNQPPAENSSSREDLRLLSVNEAKSRMGIRRENLLKLIEDKKLISKNIGGKVYVPYLSIIKYLTEPDDPNIIDSQSTFKLMKTKIKNN